MEQRTMYLAIDALIYLQIVSSTDPQLRWKYSVERRPFHKPLALIYRDKEVTY